ncbi:MAG: ATP-binding cassette domain-containing protein [Raoultibacter sp.]
MKETTKEQGGAVMDATVPLQEVAPAIFLEAHGLGLKTLMGYAYRDIDLLLGPGQILAVRGHNGSGKTALLLTLAGRMSYTEGTLRVGEFQLPRQRGKVQKTVGLGLFEQLNGLQESLKVSYAVGAEFELYGRRPGKGAVLDYLKQWHLFDIAQMLVKDLTAEKRVQLGVALACVGNPQMIVIDDIEDQLTKTQSEEIMATLVDLAHTRKMAIAVGCIERDLATMADGVCYLEKEGA